MPQSDHRRRIEFCDPPFVRPDFSAEVGRLARCQIDRFQYIGDLDHLGMLKHVFAEVHDTESLHCRRTMDCDVSASAGRNYESAYRYLCLACIGRGRCDEPSLKWLSDKSGHRHRRQWDSCMRISGPANSCP